MTNVPATARQLQVLRCVADSVTSRGFAPTLRETGRVLGVRYSTALDHLKALARKGYVRNLGTEQGTFARSWSLTPDGWTLLGEAPPQPPLPIRRPPTHALTEPSKCPSCGADTLAPHPLWLCVALNGEAYA